jgi:hypothetical protein
MSQSKLVVQSLAAAVRPSPPTNRATAAEIRKAWRDDREAWLNMAAPLGRLLLLNPACANPMPPPTKTILPQ